MAQTFHRGEDQHRAQFFWQHGQATVQLLQFTFQFRARVWRMLGAGALLLDVYEQSSKIEGSAPEAPSSAWSRLMGWIRNDD